MRQFSSIEDMCKQICLHFSPKSSMFCEILDISQNIDVKQPNISNESVKLYILKNMYSIQVETSLGSGSDGGKHKTPGGLKWAI